MNAALDSLAARYLRTVLEDSPISASYLGLHNRDGDLGDWSVDALEEQNRHMRSLLAEAEALAPDPRDVDSVIDAAVWRAALWRNVFAYEELRTHETQPGDYIYEAISACHLLIVRDFAPLEDRAASVLSRLRQIPRVLASMQANVREAPGIFAQVGAEAARGGTAFLSSVIPRLAEGVPALGRDLERISAEAGAAFERAALYLERMAATSDRPFHIGKQSFDRILRTHHLLPFGSDALLAMGWDVLRETEARLTEVAREIDPSRHWTEVVEDQKASHPPAALLKETYAKEMRRARDFVRERGLVSVPEGETLEVIDTPEFARPVLPYAAYMPPGALEPVQAGFFFVTPVNDRAPAEEREMQLRGHPSNTIPVIALHEAYPGHHLQIVRANASPNVARKLFWSTVFGEGWALYCEEMMREEGYFADPAPRLCQLNESLWRAARIVVDVGLSSGEMSIDAATDFMVGRARLERVNALAEVKRYAGTPTQPSSYMIGKRAILRIRDRFRAKEGARFSLRAFHDRLLDLGHVQPALAERALGLPAE